MPYSRYRMKAVLFDTVAVCEQLKERLLEEGILTAQVVFGLEKEKALFEATGSLGISPAECLLITNSNHHAEAAEHLSMACVGCIEGMYELPHVNTLLESPNEASPVYLNMLYCHEKGYPAVILQTERCFLKELTVADAPKLYAIRKQLQMAGCFDEPLAAPEEEAEKLSSYAKTAYSFFGYGFYGVYERESGALIGAAGFKEGSFPLEAGYLLESRAWGRGIATEVLTALVRYAKEELGITELVAKICHGNMASRRVAEKCGVRVEEGQHHHE